MGIIFVGSIFANPQVKTLSNGMVALLNPIEHQENIAIVFAYHAGSDAHTAQNAGLFKLLEYVLFNGAANKPGVPEPAAAIDVLEPSEILGGSGVDRFEFGLVTKKENIIAALDTFQYIFSRERRDFLFAQSDGFELARQSVRSLIYNELNDSNIFNDMAIEKKLFSKAPYRLDTLGADYVLEKASDEALRSLSAAFLVPNNACLAISGGFDIDTIVPLLEQRFGQLPKGLNPWSTELPLLPKPGVSRPTFLVFPDSSLAQGRIQVEMRYRGPDPKDMGSYVAAFMLQELANAPSSRFQSAITKSLPKGSSLENLRLIYQPYRNASWFSVNADITVPSGKKPVDIVFSFKENVRSTELYSIKANSSYFSASQFEKARETLMEDKMAIQNDPLRSAAYMATLWGYGTQALLQSETDLILRVGPKEVSSFVDTYVLKNLEVVMVRVDPALYEINKKAFAASGFEVISAQNALWWR